jgi:hypothetical protein
MNAECAYAILDVLSEEVRLFLKFAWDFKV